MCKSGKHHQANSEQNKQKRKRKFMIGLAQQNYAHEYNDDSDSLKDSSEERTKLAKELETLQPPEIIKTGESKDENAVADDGNSSKVASERLPSKASEHLRRVKNKTAMIGGHPNLPPTQLMDQKPKKD